MIKIALISDIHFGKDARSKEFALPNQVVNGDVENASLLTDGAAEILKQHGVEYLFLAGDLTSVGSPVEFHYCKEKITELAEKGNIIDDHVIWCSGNHDNDWRIAELGDMYKDQGDIYEIAKERYGNLAGTVADNYFGFVNVTKGPLPTSGIYEDDKMVVFVLNSSSKCIRPEVIEHGSLTIDQLEWFKKEADRYKDDHRWKIVMLHHHPFNYPFPKPCFEVSQLEEGSEFCEIVGKNGIDLVIHGHRHHPKCKTVQENDWGKPVSYICCGSFSVSDHYRNQGEIPNVFHILELSEDVGLLKMYSYEYCSSRGWQEIMLYRDEVPLDKIMYLGKVFEDRKTEEALLEMISKTEITEVFKWDKLDDSLKYKSSNVIESITHRKKFSDVCSIKVYPLDCIIITKKT